MSNYRAMLWSQGKSSGTVIAGNGTYGNGSTQLGYPYDIHHDPSTQITYVADAWNHRIMQYVLNNSTGTPAVPGTTSGPNITRIVYTYGFFFDSLTNSLIIANALYRNIVQWVLGENNWTEIAGLYGVTGNTSSTFREPHDVTLDPMGNLYVVDIVLHRVQFFLMNQQNGTIIAGVTGVAGSNAKLLNNPTSLILDNQLNLYVADCSNQRVQKFVRY